MHGSQWQNIKLAHGDFSRRYLIHVPHTLTKMAHPLVLVLHGAGSKSEDAATHYGWVQKSEKESFIVAFPQAMPLDPSRPANFKTNPNNWNDGHERREKKIDDISFLRKVVEDISAHHLIDNNRIYMTGFSNGASMTLRAGIELSDIIAAIAAISGHLWIKNPHPIRPMSMLLIAGGMDPFKPLKGGFERNPWLIKEEVIPPMKSSIEKWVKLIGIDESNKILKSKNGIDVISYGPNKNDLIAVFIVLAEQGHEWPGGQRVLPETISGKNIQTFKATDVIWNFFKTQMLT